MTLLKFTWMIQVYQTTQYVHGLFASWRQIRHVGQTVLVDNSGFRIPLSFSGIFSYLPTTKLSTTILNEYEEVYIPTPSRWDPYSYVYSYNERNTMFLYLESILEISKSYNLSWKLEKFDFLPKYSNLWVQL